MPTSEPEGMSDRPYSRVYHELADDYPDLYDSPDLAPYVRLLVAADQAWPTAARWAGYATKAEAGRLADAGLVILDGARYRIKGMDKERQSRSESASRAVNKRWEYARYTDRNTDRIATRNTDRSTETIPSRDEPRRDETSLDEPTREDAFEVFLQLTASWPSDKATPWLSRLVDDHGDGPVSDALVSEWDVSKDRKSLLGRVEARLKSEAHRLTVEAEARRARADAEYERRERERIANPSPEEQARADAAKAQVAEFVKGFGKPAA